MDEPEIEVLNQQYALANSLLDSQEPFFIELAHYIVDNAFEKLMKLLGHENVPDFDPQRHPRTGKYWSFPQLVNEILIINCPNLALVKGNILSQHQKRNFFQHKEESLFYSIREQYSKNYLSLFKQSLKELNILKDVPRPVVTHSHRAAGGNLKEMLECAGLHTRVVNTKCDKEECTATRFIMKINNIGNYTLKQVRVFIKIMDKSYPLPSEFGEKKLRKTLASLPAGHSVELILFQFMELWTGNSFVVGDEQCPFIPNIYLSFDIEFQANNAELYIKKYDIKEMFPEPLFISWRKQVLNVKFDWFTMRLTSPDIFPDLKLLWTKLEFAGRDEVKGREIALSIDELFDEKWDEFMGDAEINWHTVNWQDFLNQIFKSVPPRQLERSRKVQEAIMKYINNRNEREGATTKAGIIDIFKWKPLIIG